MAIQKYIAAASLGLFIMFVGEIITVYNFMLTPPIDNFTTLEADPKLLQFISIGIAPAVIMAAISFIMSKTLGSKIIGTMIISGGVILLVGMMYAYTLVDDIDPAYQTDMIALVPPLFMVVSIPVMIAGGILLKNKKRRRAKKEYL